MKQLFILLLLPLSAALTAQPDAYTQTLIDGISVQYTLTGETFPVYDSEREYAQNATTYGLQRSDGAVDDQDFTRVTSMRTTAGPENQNRWNAAWRVDNQRAVNRGDKLLWVLYLRHKPVDDEGVTGKLAIVAERNDTYDKEVDHVIDVTQDWALYYVPFEITTRDHAPGGLGFGLQIGGRTQEIQVGGVAIMNYGPEVPFSQLPQNLNTGNYGGNEEDAAWRAPAADRIDALRKADLEMTVIGTDGQPVAGAGVALRMQRHAFKFGTATRGSRFPGGRAYNATYVDKLFNLDGRGHGFNAIVYENDLKWPGWEQEWITTNPQLRRTIDYLAGRGVHQRGHVLLWPGWENMPRRMLDNAADEAYLRGQVLDHLETMLGDSGENFDARGVTDWDVLNEINTNTDLAAALAGAPGYATGREFYTEVFNRARELAPGASLYINDYITLSLKNGPGNGLYQQYQTFLQDLIDGGAPINGVGFQGHLSASPNSIYEVLETYDDFYNRFGLEAKVTEFDLPRNVDPDVLPKYIRDFLTATFSHPSMTGIVYWNWWDQDTWRNPGANLYDPQWNEKPGHAAFVDLVFDEWWTNADLVTDAAGRAGTRGFKGAYEVTLTCDGTEVSTSVNLTGDAQVQLDCNQLIISTTTQELPSGSVVASPNPSDGPVLITNNLILPLRASLYTSGGRKVWEGVLPHGSSRLALDLAAGSYRLHYSDGYRSGVTALIRR